MFCSAGVLLESITTSRHLHQEEPFGIPESEYDAFEPDSAPGEAPYEEPSAGSPLLPGEDTQGSAADDSDDSSMLLALLLLFCICKYGAVPEQGCPLDLHVFL
jgi:hypothetical protein